MSIVLLLLPRSRWTPAPLILFPTFFNLHSPYREMNTLKDYIVGEWPEDGDGLTIMLLGSTRSGKTSLLVAYILPALQSRKNTIICIMSGSPNSLPLQDIAKDQEVDKCRRGVPVLFDHVEPKIIDRLVQANRAISDKAKRYSPCIVLDDIAETRHSPVLRDLVLRKRNDKVSTVLATQYPKLVAKDMRESFNIHVLLKLNTDDGVRQCCEMYFRGRVRKVWRQASLDRCMDMYEAVTELGPGCGFVLNNLTAETFVLVGGQLFDFPDFVTAAATLSKEDIQGLFR